MCFCAEVHNLLLDFKTRGAHLRYPHIDRVLSLTLIRRRSDKLLVRNVPKRLLDGYSQIAIGCDSKSNLYVCSASLTRNVRLNSKWQGNCKSSCKGNAWILDIHPKWKNEVELKLKWVCCRRHGCDTRIVYLMNTVEPLKEYRTSLICVGAAKTLAAPTKPMN